MLTAAQLRAARALLGLDQRTLAERYVKEVLLVRAGQKADPLGPAAGDQVELGEKRHARVGGLSGGQKQRLAIACALASATADGVGHHDDVFLRSDGSSVHVAYSRACVDRGDAPGGIIVVRADSGRKRAEQERKRAERLAEQLRALGAEPPAEDA